MSAMDHLAAPAPEVEEARADRATPSAPLTVTPVAACEDVTVEAVKAVEPAVTVDDPKLFAPPMTKEEASHLSVKALRGSGIEFEAKVGIKNNSICLCWHTLTSSCSHFPSFLLFHIFPVVRLL